MAKNMFTCFDCGGGGGGGGGAALKCPKSDENAL